MTDIPNATYVKSLAPPPVTGNDTPLFLQCTFLNASQVLESFSLKITNPEIEIERSREQEEVRNRGGREEEWRDMEERGEADQ